MDRVISRSNTILIPRFILAALVVWLALPQGATFGSVASNVFPDSGNLQYPHSNSSQRPLFLGVRILQREASMQPNRGDLRRRGEVQVRTNGREGENDEGSIL